ncbi:TPA: glycosyltransferase family 4 protein [Clostridium perfringens]
MKIVLSSNIDHYRYTARALQNEGFQIKYISGVLYTKKPWYYNFIGNLKSWIDNRIEKNINVSNIKSLKCYEIIYKSIRNSNLILKFITKSQIDVVFNNIFDYRTKLYLMQENNIDVFHYVNSIGYKSAKYSKKKDIKVIIDDRAEHKGFLYKLLKDEYDKLNLKFDDRSFWTVDNRKDYEIADYIITPSTFSKETFLSQGVDEKKLIVIPYGCNINNFYPKRKENNNVFRVIYVGSICIRKGAHYLVEAFKNIHNPNIELLMIGKVEDELLSIMKNKSQNIKHIEYIPNKELNDYYTQSDVFILPSLSDSFSLATLEAMSAGLPVIITENVGAKDFVNDGENGFIIPIKDSESIKEKIIYLYNNKDKKNIMGNKARELALTVTWESYEKKVDDFYRYLKGQLKNSINN